MRRTAELVLGRSMLVRLLLVVALAAGLSAMHVLAGVVGQQHAEAHATSSAPAVGGMSGGHGHMLVTSSSAAVASPTSSTQASDHQHHSAVDCVLFLSAGVLLLGVLVAWAAVRALRPACWPTASWPKASTAITPWRGPPPWRWPRIRLCVIRV